MPDPHPHTIEASQPQYPYQRIFVFSHWASKLEPICCAVKGANAWQILECQRRESYPLDLRFVAENSSQRVRDFLLENNVRAAISRKSS